ncbi:MAG: amidase [Alphaproteobacteria bacterium]|nr:amidase [Alphaproteobacteria bacterium]
MSFAEYSAYDGLGLAALVARGEVTPDELLEIAIARLEAVNPRINAIAGRLYEEARGAIAGGLPAGPFAGVPFATKDLDVAVKGARLTNGSRLFRDRAMDHDATLVARYRAAGLVLFAQTTTPEFGLTVTTESALFGPTRNPWNLERVAGGSSGGAAAAVAAGIVPVAQGSDGGGSIRVPASCCGLFGLKPSRGRTPHGPLRLDGWNGLSMAHVISRSVRDSAALLDATEGPEPGTSLSPPSEERPYLEEVQRPPRRLRIALVTETPEGTPIHPDCLDAVRGAASLLDALGHIIEEAPLPFDGEALRKALATIAASHTHRILEDLAAARGSAIAAGEVEPVTAAIAKIGGRTGAADLVRALDATQTAAIAWARFTETFDMALSPTLAKPPLELGVISLTPERFERFGPEFNEFTPFTAAHNATGAPAMSVPLYWNAEGLPIGVMLAGRFGDEATLFRLAGELERAHPWADKRAPL